ncbi:MAG: NAD(P)-dependent oxidoreductase [Thermomicrobiales bacterium]
MAKRRILVTGADGLIGRMVMDAWRGSSRYEPVGLARKPGPYTDVLGDISDLEAIRPAFNNIDAVVHLAATSAVGSSWDAVLASNLIGTYNVFEAARQAGVEQIVFASSNHAIGTNETANQPELWEMDDPRVWDETAEIKPDSLYGVSKVYGEALARYYVDHHGMRAFCLRIGGVRGKDDPSHPDNLWKPELDNDPEVLKTRTRTRAVWLSERDCVQLIERCLDSDERWFLGYGISDNPRKFWDIEHARKVLGYAPQDSAPAEIVPGRA